MAQQRKDDKSGPDSARDELIEHIGKHRSEQPRYRFQLYNEFTGASHQFRTADAATAKADELGANRLVYLGAGGGRPQQVDKVDGQWYVRHDQTPLQASQQPPSNADRSLASVQQAIDGESLRAIETRAQLRVAAGRVDALTDGLMAAADSNAFLSIDDKGAREIAAVSMAKTARMFPLYREELIRDAPARREAALAVYALDDAHTQRNKVEANKQATATHEQKDSVQHDHVSKPAQQSEVIQGKVRGPLVIDAPAEVSRAREMETDALRAGQAQGIPKAPAEIGSEKAASKPLQIDEPDVQAKARVGDAEVAALRSGQARGEKARMEVDPHRADPLAGLNAILPVGPQRAPDSERDAELRAKAMASIDSGDKQADAKREIVDRMDGGELTRFLSGADRQAAEKVLRDAAARQERELMSAPVREANPPLAERFNITRKLFSTEYQFRDQPGKVAFTERFGHMRSESHSHAAVLGMVDRAAERGWSTIRVNGTGEFKRQAWIAAEARGIKAVGYEPTKGDQEAAKAESARLEAEQGARATQADRAPTAKYADAAQEVRPAPGAAQARSEDRQRPEQGDLQAEAKAARQREEAVRSDPRASNAAISAAKEDRKNADYQAWAGQPGALDRAQQREASQRGLLGDSKGAVLRAFDLAMERQGIAAPQQEALRKELGWQLDAVQATGRIPLVKVYDKNAPRGQAPAAPKVEHRKAHSERVR